jgi:hypothetical protein
MHIWMPAWCVQGATLYFVPTCAWAVAAKLQPFRRTVQQHVPPVSRSHTIYRSQLKQAAGLAHEKGQKLGHRAFGAVHTVPNLPPGRPLAVKRTVPANKHAAASSMKEALVMAVLGRLGLDISPVIWLCFATQLAMHVVMTQAWRSLDSCVLAPIQVRPTSCLPDRDTILRRYHRVCARAML